MTVSPDQLEASGLRFDVTDAVATVTLNRPGRRNAMTPAVWRGLAAIGSDLPPRVRVVVVRGAGPSFSSGIDLRMFSADGVPGEESLAGAADPDVEAGIAAYQAGFLWLRDPGIVSIAAVQGHAIGAGFQLALACVDGAIADLTAALLATDAAAARATKELLAQAGGNTLEQQSAAERRAQAALLRARRTAS